MVRSCVPFPGNDSFCIAWRWFRFTIKFFTSNIIIES